MKYSFEIRFETLYLCDCLRKIYYLLVLDMPNLLQSQQFTKLLCIALKVCLQVIPEL